MERNEEKHLWISRTLHLLDARGARDIERISSILKDEPRARVRRINGQALLNIEDVQKFSKLLTDEYPELVYFFANYKTGRPTPSKFPDDLEVTLFPDLHVATVAALEMGVKRPAYNGPDFNRPSIFCRLPWPEEQASGDPEKLIGGREFPDDFFNLTSQHRRLGRWFMFRYGTNGYVYPRVPVSRNADWRLDKTKLPNEEYLPFNLLSADQSEFSSSYDVNDLETTAFAKRIDALWRRISTSKIAHYDPATGEVVYPENWDGKFLWRIGKQALAGALADPKRYAGFAPRASTDGGRLLLGPVPRASKKALKRNSKSERSL